MVAELSIRIPGGVDAPGAARSALRPLHAELPPDTLQVVTLLVSELVSNAVRHANAESIALQLFLRDDCVRVDVTDEGPGFTTGPNPVEPGEHGGFGLYFVDELASRWGVYDEDQTRVWFEIDR